MKERECKYRWRHHQEETFKFWTYKWWEDLVTLGLCWRPLRLQGLQHTQSQAAGSSVGTQLQAPHWVCLGWPRGSGPTVSRYPTIRARGGVQVTMTVVSVSLINWRLVGASNSRKRDETSLRNSCTSELSYWKS